MEIGNFAEKVCAVVEKKLGKDYRVEIKEIRKNNGVCKTGLVVLAKDSDIASTVYLEGFHKAYEEGKTFGEIISCIVHACHQSMVKGEADMEFFRHFESVMDRICYRLVGRKGNERLLDEIPHMEFLDLAICFYYAYCDDGVGSGSILIHNSHMEMWDTSTEELYQLAKVNTPRLFPWEIGTLPEVLGVQEGEGCREGMESLDLEDARDIPMKILTNSSRNYGAACILYPGVLEEAGKRMGGDFYILPSSLHEVILVPCDGMIPEECMKTMISDINNTQVEPEDVLSNSLYCYDVRKKKLKLV